MIIPATTFSCFSIIIATCFTTSDCNSMQSMMQSFSSAALISSSESNMASSPAPQSFASFLQPTSTAGSMIQTPTVTSSANIMSSTAEPSSSSTEPFASSPTSTSPTPSQVSSPSGCTAQVDQVSVELSGVTAITEAILYIFREETINETNIYCNGQNKTLVCHLPQSFMGSYTIINFVGCYFTNFRRRQSTSVIRYYITQPDNSAGILNLNAMLEITNRALPGFTAATGFTVTSVRGIKVPRNNADHLHAAVIVGSTLASVILIILIVFSTMIIAHLVIRIVTRNKSKSKNRVRPGSDSSDDSLNKDTGGNPDTILLTQ